MIKLNFILSHFLRWQSIKVLIPLATIFPTYATEQQETTASRPNEIIHCLAREEERFHERKDIGPLYRLNQVLLNEMVSWNDIHLKPSYIRRICQHDQFGPSVRLLQEILLNREDVFEINLDADHQGIIAFQVQEIRSFIARIPMIFFTYAADIQLIVGDPHCFTELVPEMSYFHEQFKYLEPYVGPEQLVSDRQKLRSTFEKLSDPEALKKQCQNKADRPS